MTSSRGVGSTQSTAAATARVSNLYLLLDRSTLTNSGVATAKVTAVAVDSKNNVVHEAKLHVDARLTMGWPSASS